MGDPTVWFQQTLAEMREQITRQPTQFGQVIEIASTVPAHPGKLVGTITREQGPLGRWWYNSELGPKHSFWVFNTQPLGYTWAMPLVRSIFRRGNELYCDDLSTTLIQLGQPIDDKQVRAGTGRRVTWRDSRGNLLVAFTPPLSTKYTHVK